MSRTIVIVLFFFALYVVGEFDHFALNEHMAHGNELKLVTRMENTVTEYQQIYPWYYIELHGKSQGTEWNTTLLKSSHKEHALNAAKALCEKKLFPCVLYENDIPVLDNEIYRDRDILGDLIVARMEDGKVKKSLYAVL